MNSLGIGFHILGHIVSKDGVETDPKKVKVIQEWPIPKTVYDVRSFLGFTNYYRKFLFRYSKIARPLHELTSGENSKKKRAPVEWEEKHQKAFDTLKQLFTEAPILAYANYTKPFKVYTDASEIGSRGCNQPSTEGDRTRDSLCQ